MEIKKFKLNEKYCANPQCNCIHKKEPILSNVQCGVDTFITAKMVEMSCKQKVDQIILLSGDGDFQSAIQIVSEYNIDVMVVGTNISELLRSDKNCKCIEIPDIVFNEINNLAHVPEYKYSPTRFNEISNVNLRKNNKSLSKKEINPQNSNKPGFHVKDTNIDKK